MPDVRDWVPMFNDLPIGRSTQGVAHMPSDRKIDREIENMLAQIPARRDPATKVLPSLNNTNGSRREDALLNIILAMQYRLDSINKRVLVLNQE